MQATTLAHAVTLNKAGEEEAGNGEPAFKTGLLHVGRKCGSNMAHEWLGLLVNCDSVHTGLPKANVLKARS